MTSRLFDDFFFVFRWTAVLDRLDELSCCVVEISSPRDYYDNFFFRPYKVFPPRLFNFKSPRMHEIESDFLLFGAKFQFDFSIRDFSIFFIFYSFILFREKQQYAELRSQRGRARTIVQWKTRETRRLWIGNSKHSRNEETCCIFRAVFPPFSARILHSLSVYVESHRIFVCHLKKNSCMQTATNVVDYHQILDSSLFKIFAIAIVCESENRRKSNNFRIFSDVKSSWILVSGNSEIICVHAKYEV